MKLQTLASSVDATKVSLAVRGVLLGMIPMAMHFFGITEAEVTQIVNIIVDIVFYGTSLASLVITLYGLLRKLDGKNQDAS